MPGGVGGEAVQTHNADVFSSLLWLLRGAPRIAEGAAPLSAPGVPASRRGWRWRGSTSFQHAQNRYRCSSFTCAWFFACAARRQGSTVPLRRGTLCKQRHAISRSASYLLAAQFLASPEYGRQPDAASQLDASCNRSWCSDSEVVAHGLESKAEMH